MVISAATGCSRATYLNEGQDIDLVSQVKAARRFIEQQDPGLLDQCPGNSHFLELTAADLVD